MQLIRIYSNPQGLSNRMYVVSIAVRAAVEYIASQEYLCAYKKYKNNLIAPEECGQ